MKILAIDDNQDNLTTLKAVAQDALPGSRLLTALDGPRGLALAQAEDPDVILLDIVMPGMDGFEVCRQLKANARLSSIPVVFLTALRTDRESRIRALEAGAEAFLSKPIDELELTAQIRAMVRLKVANRMQRMEKEELAALVAERTRQLEVELAERKHAEVELNRVAEEWQTTFDSTADAIWVLDNQHRVLRSNQAAEKMFGRPRSEMLCEACWTLAHGTTEPHPNCPFVRARQSGHREAMELEQNDRWFEITVDPVRDHTSEITGAVHIASDITERKQIEAIQTFLAKTSSGMTKEPFFNALARFLAENLRMNFVCIDRLEGDGLNARTVAVWHDGKFEDNVTYALKDTPCGDVVGQQVCCFPANVCQLFPRDPVLQDLRAESYAGVTLFDHTGRPIGLIAVIGRMPLTNRSQAEAALKMVAGRAAGELERQQAEAALRESEERHRTLYEQASDGILLMTAEGEIVGLNKAFAQMHGYSEPEMMGMNVKDLDGPEDARVLSDRVRRITEGGTLTFEVMHYHKDGHLFPIAVSCCQITLAGKFYVQTICRDITEQKRLEAELRQSQKMESIGHLAGGVAHDFNNILASQILQLDLIQSGVVAPEEIAEAIRQIHADAERAAKLVRQLLLFSRRQVMQPGALDLNEVVNNISKLLRRIIGEDIWMQVRLHPAPLNLVADAGMLEQVIVNFATNARDAMPKGGQLLIETSAATLTEADAQRLKAEGGPGAYICLSVSDTGTGIPPEVVSKIFEPFFTTKDVGKGTGLGLASVFGIVKQHKGGIDVDNRPGKGVTFRVYLPTHTASATPPRLTANQPRIRGRAETILLVEDEPSLRKLMIRLLECHGYQVLPAANGVAALELWRQQRDAVALLCTDMVLPEGMSGSELAGHLRAEKPELKVLYVSGYSRDAVENRLNLSAGETFMQKPFLPEQLLETVHRCLNGVPQSQ